MLRPVDGDSVPDLILYNQHADFLQLFSELLDVNADQTVADIHIRPVIEDIERAFDIDFQCGCDPLCFLL